MKQRHVKPGEMLAMDPSQLHRGPNGDMFWMLGSSTTPNARKGDLIEVTIRGELEHHEADAFGGESYEGILKRVEAAMKGDACDGEYADEDEFQASPPEAVVLVIDSPGGVVAGLNETVAALQRMKAKYEIPIYAYVNEMAASAAYAIACAADEVYCPPSAIIGSIGVISTMVSQARKNAKDGYDVRLLTSGARKADGHLHAPISDDALKVEMRRVNKLALAFFKIASKARGVPVETIQSYEAGIFLGPEAVARGLADGVISFEDFILGASQSDNATQSGGNQTDRRVTKPSEKAMPVALAALIKKTKAKIAAAIAADAEPEKLAALYADLAAYKKTKKHVEHTETEEGADGDEEGDDDGEGDDDDKDSDKSEKMSEEEEKLPAKDKDDDEEEDEDEEEEESEESEEKAAKAALALVREVTGMKGKKSLGAARALFATAKSAAEGYVQMKRENRARDKAALIEGARGKYLTKAEATWLKTQPKSVVEGFVEMRKANGVIVNTDDTTLVKAKHAAPGTEESLPADTIKMIDDAVASWTGPDKAAFRKTLVDANLATHKKLLATATNGQGRI